MQFRGTKCSEGINYMTPPLTDWEQAKERLTAWTEALGVGGPTYAFAKAYADESVVNMLPALVADLRLALSRTDEAEAWRPKLSINVKGVGRDSDRTLLVLCDGRPSDDDMRSLHDWLCGRPIHSPPKVSDDGR